MKNKIMPIIAAASLIAAAAAMKFLPDEVPINYNVVGEVGGRGSKYWLFLFPLIACIYLLLFYNPAFFTRKQKFKESADE